MLVYRVEREYIEFYEFRNLGTRDINESLTNIEVGLSVFSAFISPKVVNMTVIQNCFMAKGL